MKFFISHASKDADIARCFSSFLSDLSVDVSVFCSSISGTINIGDDFVKTIEDGLNDSDVFIPLISNNYLRSKYCMIELGYAYAKIASEKSEYKILPFCLPPVSKSDALMGTPLSHRQTAELNNREDIHNFLKTLKSKGLLKDLFISNDAIYSFIDQLNKIIMNSTNILGNAVIMPICSDALNKDAIQHTARDDKHIVNFNLFANGKNERPEFLSLVLKFPGLFNFRDFMLSNNDIHFLCDINNYTNSLTHIDIEFKYGETHQILKSYKISLSEGNNHIAIPINDMNVDGLTKISEICFVAWDDYMIEPEGMYTISNIQVK